MTTKWTTYPKKRRTLFWVPAAFGFGLLVSLACFAPALMSIIALKSENPQLTLTMAGGLSPNGDCPRFFQWVPLSKIAPVLIKAVTIAEDPRFFKHSGIDRVLLKNSIKRNWREKRIVRGASTITMQAAKNLFLKPERTFARKIKEVVIAFMMETLLSKKRIMEIYLNVAEWGPDVFGAEAAANYHFDKHANELTSKDAAYLASILPSPKAAKESKSDFRSYVARMIILEKLTAMGL